MLGKAPHTTPPLRMDMSSMGVFEAHDVVFNLDNCYGREYK